MKNMREERLGIASTDTSPSKNVTIQLDDGRDRLVSDNSIEFIDEPNATYGNDNITPAVLPPV